MSEVEACPSSTRPDPFQGVQTVLILVGLIASGKSTFALALEKHFPQFRRCNQDDLGNRQRVEELAYQTLCEGRSPCIDRTNFNAMYFCDTRRGNRTKCLCRQRSYWTMIARSFPRSSISVIVFDTPYQVCASRLERRTSHPTIRDAQHGISVLQRFASEFQLPSPEEGYDHIIYLRPEDHPHAEYTRNDVLSILERLQASTRDTEAAVIQPRIQSHFGPRGTFSRSGRTRGYHGAYAHRPYNSSQRATLHSTSRFASRGSDSSDWRRTSSVDGPDHARSDQRSSTANVPSMEGSKGKHSATEFQRTP